MLHTHACCYFTIHSSLSVSNHVVRILHFVDIQTVKKLGYFTCSVLYMYMHVYDHVIHVNVICQKFNLEIFEYKTHH